MTDGKSGGDKNSNEDSYTMSEEEEDRRAEGDRKRSAQEDIDRLNRKADTIPVLSVSQALRTNLDQFVIVGQISTVTSVYQMVKAVNVKCLKCGHKWNADYKENPRYVIPNGRGFSCSCTKEDESSSVSIDPEWIPALDIQLQDTEKFNSIEKIELHYLETIQMM